jgi:hypothetical protein
VLPRVSRRPKRRGFSVFLVPEVNLAVAVPAGLAPAIDTVDNRAPRRLRLRNPWPGYGEWWELVVMLHRSASGTFFDGRFYSRLAGSTPSELVEMAGNAPA